MRSTVLRLLLAEAEIRRARETGMSLPLPPDETAPRRRARPLATLGIAAALVIGAAGYTVTHLGPLAAPGAPAASVQAVRAAPALQRPGEAVPLGTGRYLRLAFPAVGSQSGEPSAPGVAEPRTPPDRFSDDPASRFDPAALPALPGSDSFTTPEEPTGPSPRF
jgi:hypothetical protein